jgi:hypothetical protein
LIFYCISGEESLQNNVQTTKTIKISINKKVFISNTSVIFFPGLGLEAVRQLCLKLTGDKDVVILAARSRDLGLQAVQDLNQQGKTDW